MEEEMLLRLIKINLYKRYKIYMIKYTRHQHDEHALKRQKVHETLIQK